MIECPTPGKRAFASEAAAEQRADEVRLLPDGDDLAAYRCPCGEWHLRNRSKYETKNAFHRKQRARRFRVEAARAHERHDLGLDKVEDLLDTVDRILEAMGIDPDSNT